MKPIVLGKAATGVDVTLDLGSLLVSHMLLQAASGGGKSRSLRRLAEQCVPHVQTIIIDPEGEFSTLRERFDFLLVGDSGETPADVRTARGLAVKLRELRVSAICDLFSLAGQPEETHQPAKGHRGREREQEDRRHLWVREFLTGLLNAPRSSWTNLLLIVDEGQLFAPEKGETWSPALNMMKQTALLARKRGIGLIVATQRVGIVSNTVLSSLQNIVIGKARLDVDQERCAKSLGIRRADRETFFEELKRLKPGRFFAQGPAIGDERVLLHFGDVMTTHPEPGDDRRTAAPPPPSAKILHLLPRLAELPDTGDTPSAEAPEPNDAPAKRDGSLRTEVNVLKAKLREAESRAVRTVEVTKVVAVPVVPPGLADDISRAIDGLKAALQRATASADHGVAVPAAARRASVVRADRPQLRPKQPTAKPPSTQRRTDFESIWRLPVREAMLVTTAAAGDSIEIGSLALLIGSTPKVSTFRLNLGALVRDGKLEREPGADGRKRVSLTEAGRTRLVTPPPLPTAQDLIALWKTKLGDGKMAALLEIVLSEGESDVEEIARRLDVPVKLSTFRLAVGRYIRCGLIVRRRNASGGRTLAPSEALTALARGRRGRAVGEGSPRTSATMVPSVSREIKSAPELPQKRLTRSGAEVRSVSRPRPDETSDGGRLSKACRSVLGGIAQFGGSASDQQIALVTGYPLNTSTLANAISALNVRGLTTGSSTRRELTAAGLVAAGPVSKPWSGRQLFELWTTGEHKRHLSKCAREIVRALYERGSLSRRELAAATGYPEDGSTLANGMSTLRILELAHGPPGGGLSLAAGFLAKPR